MSTNCISTAIAKYKQCITDRKIPATELAELSRSLDMDPIEFCKFQEYKSFAFAEGKLTLDEAQMIYNYLGETPDHFNSQPVEVKAVLTMVFAELLKASIKASTHQSVGISPQLSAKENKS